MDCPVGLHPIATLVLSVYDIYTEDKTVNYFIKVRLTVITINLKSKNMLYTIAVILIILWLLGFVTSFMLGGFIHILLVIAVVMILLRLIQGRGI